MGEGQPHIGTGVDIASAGIVRGPFRHALEPWAHRKPAGET
jgi:hypothetical protein